MCDFKDKKNSRTPASEGIEWYIPNKNMQWQVSLLLGESFRSSTACYSISAVSLLCGMGRSLLAGGGSASKFILQDKCRYKLSVNVPSFCRSKGPLLLRPQI